MTSIALRICMALILSISASATDKLTSSSLGHSIAKRADQSDLGFSSSRAQVSMKLADRRGTNSVRSMTLLTLERPDQGLGDRSLIVFRSPSDIAGTKLLSHARLLEDDLQWLYLPSLSRVKRIASANKAGPFVGSEFAFEDLTGQELDKYEYEHLRGEGSTSKGFDIVKRTPLYKRSGYKYQLVWFDRSDGQIRKIEYFNRTENLKKTLTASEYQTWKGGFLRPTTMHMVNHVTGKETTLTYSGYEFDLSLSPRDFDRSSLNSN